MYAVTCRASAPIQPIVNSEIKTESAGVQSVEVGLALIKPLIAAGRPLPLKAIAQAAGLAPPKAHRYLVSLIRAGLIERVSGSRYYVLGPLAVELGLAALGMVDQDGTARRAVSDLALETGVTCCTAAWVNEAVVVTAVEFGIGVIFTGVRLASRLTLLRSASGRVFLAYLARERTARALAAELSHETYTGDDVERIISETRRDGISTAYNLVVPGMSGLAVPVFDHSGHIVYTLTMTGQTGEYDFKVGGALAQQAMAKAAELSARLGFKPQSAERA
jgi:DNA-binding IclR family transcriptional regulator